MTMARYLKIPVYVDAVQLTQDMIDAHVLDDADLPDGCRVSYSSAHRTSRQVFRAVVRLKNRDKDLVMPGEWVVRHADGTFSVCTQDEFEATYQPVDDPMTPDPRSDTMSDEKVPLRLDDDESRAIWSNAERVAARVARWPAWKRGSLFVVRLTCCGREDGSYGPGTWTEADAFREAYLSGPGVRDGRHPTIAGHERSAIIEAAPCP